MQQPALGGGRLFKKTVAEVGRLGLVHELRAGQAGKYILRQQNGTPKNHTAREPVDAYSLAFLGGIRLHQALVGEHLIPAALGEQVHQLAQ